MTMSANDDTRGRIDVGFAADDVVELKWSGFISKATVGHVPGELVRWLGDRRPPFALFDATGVTSFSADSREPGGAILEELKTRGVHRAYVVTSSSAVRMIGSAVALAVGLRICFYESRDIALAEIDKLRRA